MCIRFLQQVLTTSYGQHEKPHVTLSVRDLGDRGGTLSGAGRLPGLPHPCDFRSTILSVISIISHNQLISNPLQSTDPGAPPPTIVPRSARPLPHASHRPGAGGHHILSPATRRAGARLPLLLPCLRLASCPALTGLSLPARGAILPC